jgi:hypothetical protein
MRAPNEINKETGELQSVVMNKRNIVNVDMPEEPIEEPIPPTINNEHTNEVEFYFNLCKNDHDKKNGGRGELILAKAFKQQHEKGWSNSQCKELIDLLCKEWGCPEKILRLQKYFN